MNGGVCFLTAAADISDLCFRCTGLKHSALCVGRSGSWSSMLSESELVNKHVQSHPHLWAAAALPQIITRFCPVVSLTSSNWTLRWGLNHGTTTKCQLTSRCYFSRGLRWLFYHFFIWSKWQKWTHLFWCNILADVCLFLTLLRQFYEPLKSGHLFTARVWSCQCGRDSNGDFLSRFGGQSVSVWSESLLTTRWLWWRIRKDWSLSQGVTPRLPTMGGLILICVAVLDFAAGGFL